MFFVQQLDINECIEKGRAGEWVPYVQPARDEREQNLEAFLKDGQLHYRSTRTIGIGGEVLVWYCKEMAAALGVPELMPFHIRGTRKIHQQFTSMNIHGGRLLRD